MHRTRPACCQAHFFPTLCLWPLLFLWLFLPGTSWATPVNNLCANAIELTLGASVNGTTVAATGTGAPASCSGVTLSSSTGVWYRFTGTGSTTVLAILSASFDTRVAVFSGSCGALTCVTANNNNNCNDRSRITMATAAGTTYHVYVSGIAQGTFSLVVQDSDPGTNTTMATAKWMECGEALVSNNIGVTPTPVTTAGCSAFFGTSSKPARWYRVLGDGRMKTAQVFSFGWDVVIAVQRITCSGLVCVGWSDSDNCTEQVSWTTVPGETYVVTVHPFSSATGWFELRLTCSGSTGAAPNDACTAPIPVAVNCTVHGNTGLGTPDDVPGGCGSVGAGLWYSVVGNGQPMTASLCGSQFDTQLALYTGSCGALNCVAFNDDHCGPQSELVWASVPGTTYLLHVSGASTGNFSLSISTFEGCIAPAGTVAMTENCAADTYTVTLTLTSLGQASSVDVVAQPGGLFPGGSNYSGPLPATFTASFPVGEARTVGFVAADVDLCQTILGTFNGAGCILDCNNEPAGTAFLDNCGICVGGSTGLTACIADCFGVFGGTAIIDNCGVCSGGSTNITPNSTCIQDCNGVWNGTAFTDDCGNCVGGDTGGSACVADCNGDFGGTAALDGCGDCAGGGTGNEPCSAGCLGTYIVTVASCSSFFDETSFQLRNGANIIVLSGTSPGTFSFDATGTGNGIGPFTFHIETLGTFNDNCATYSVSCASGTLVNGTITGGLSFGSAPLCCIQETDCAGVIDGNAFTDGCGTCVGGSTGLSACVADCNGDFGGTAFIDNCDLCAGGNTDVEPNSLCTQDCTGTWGGTAFTDGCGECVGGSTGLDACTCPPSIIGQPCGSNIGTCNPGVWACVNGVLTCVGGNGPGIEICDGLDNDCDGIVDNNCVNADCNGTIDGTASIDNCGVCSGGTTGIAPNSTCVQDCNGVWGGSAFLDNCNTCVGGNTGTMACIADCNGDFGGTAVLDNCGNCVGGNTDQEPCIADCNGVFGGTAFRDNCNNCVGGNTGEVACVADCNGDFGSTASIDDCGVCAGGETDVEPNSTCTQDCTGTWGGTAFTDGCGECVGGSTGLEPCACPPSIIGQPCGSNVGTCNPGVWDCVNGVLTCVGGNGPGIEICDGLDNDCDGVIDNNCVNLDCNGTIDGTASIDNCGVCSGGTTGVAPNSNCVQDCNGVWDGSAFLDNCNTCVGGNTGLIACVADCNGDFGGTAVLDNCGTCVGGNTDQEPCAADCNGDAGGSAFLDNCNTCVGGATGMTACVADCNGDFGGTAFIDNCDVCAGGNTYVEPNSTCAQDCTGTWGGTAYTDGCGECVGGSTGLEPCACPPSMIGQPCGSNVGTCNPGVWACVEGVLTCVGGNGPSLEICDGLDNDCDGIVDNDCVVNPDCNGVPGGTAYLDACGACVGGSTGIGAISAEASVINADCSANTFDVLVIIPETGGPIEGVQIDWTINGLGQMPVSGVTFTTLSGITAGSVLVVIVSNSLSGVCTVVLGPYTHDCDDPCELTLAADAGADALVFYGPYAGQSCTTLNGTASGGTPFPGGEYLLQWGSGTAVYGTFLPFTVCPTVSSTYILTVTDANGCVTTDEVHVEAIDTQCGGPGSQGKVRMCINGVNVCIATQAVEAVLAGNPNANLGPCPKTMAQLGPGLALYPNPNNGQLVILTLNDIPEDIERITVDLFDLTGKCLQSEEHAVKGNAFLTVMDLNGTLASGVYLMLVNVGEHLMTQRFVIAP